MITLNLSDTGTIEYQLMFKGDTTQTLTDSSNATIIQQALNALSTISALGNVEVEMEKAEAEYILITVYFVSVMEFAEDINVTIVNGSNSYESINIQEYQSNLNTVFSVSVGLRATGPVDATTTAATLQNKLNDLLVSKCSLPTNVAKIFRGKFEGWSPLLTAGAIDRFNPPYCGRHSIRNPRYIYRPIHGYSTYTVNSFANRYVSNVMY